MPFFSSGDAGGGEYLSDMMDGRTAYEQDTQGRDVGVEWYYCQSLDVIGRRLAFGIPVIKSYSLYFWERWQKLAVELTKPKKSSRRFAVGYKIKEWVKRLITDPPSGAPRIW